MMTKRINIKLLATIASFIFLVLVNLTSIKTVYAADTDPCTFEKGKFWEIRPGKCMFKNVAESFGEDIRKTVTNSAVTMLTETPSQIAFNRSTEQTHVCSIKMMGDTLNPKGGYNVYVGEEDLLEEVKNADCSDLEWNLIAYDMGIPQEQPTSRKSYSGIVSGLYTATGSAVYENEIPANLAYYAKDVASKIPVVKNTAFAFGPYEDNSPLWDAVLKVWGVSKNISFGLLALFMLYIGIMIMMRKQIDPRTTVTVQNALPKIVIAVILITFSYAIGAFGAELVRALTKLAYAPLTNFSWTNKPGLVGTWMITASQATFRSGIIAGILGAIMQIIIMLILIIISIIILFKTLAAYVKIIIGIWTGPIVFAWGAIPGNEDQTVNWFKNLLVNVLTIPLMKLGLALSLYISWEMMRKVEDVENAGGWLVTFGSGAGLGKTSWLTGVVIPFFTIMLLFWTLKSPKKLRKAILDEKR